MSTSPFSQIDLSKLPPPQTVEALSFDEILAQITARFKTSNPALVDSISFESEPITAIFQAWAYREYILRQRINTAYQASLVAFATGSDLDNLAALIPLTRNDGETDTDFRQRIRLAPEAFSVAGPAAAYIFHAKQAHQDIIDVQVITPMPGRVDIYILTNNPSADADIIQTVRDTLERVRPLTDAMSVSLATTLDYDIVAELTITQGANRFLVQESALDALQKYLAGWQGIGKPVYRSAIQAALHVEGVEAVSLISPNSNLTPQPNEAAIASATTLTVIGT